MSSRWLVCLVLGVGCFAEGPEGAEQHQAATPTPDAWGTWDAYIASLVIAGVESTVVRVGPQLYLASSRSAPAGTAASSMTIAGSAGWYANTHPTLRLTVIQLAPGTVYTTPTSTINTTAREQDQVICHRVDPDPYLPSRAISVVITAIASTSIKLGAGLDETFVGAPCFRGAAPELIGMVDAVKPTSASLVPASAIEAWIGRLNQLATARIAAHAGGQNVAGPYTLYVQTATNPSQQLCLDAEAGSVSSAAAVQQVCSGAKSQQYFLDGRVDPARPQLRSNQSGMCVEVPNATISSNTPFVQAGCDQDSNQRFYREPPPNFVLPPRHRYRPVHSSLCMAAQSGQSATTGGLPVRQMTWAVARAAHELWHIVWVPPS